MEKRKLKVIVAILLLITLTMTNFLFVGSSLISYAYQNDDIATNHKNVEFNAFFKGANDEKTKEKEIVVGENQDIFMYLQISVKKEGYFNGEITLENSNFKLKETTSSYVNKLEDNKITLNQINAGETAEIEIRVEPVNGETIKPEMLNINSKLNINGIYRDSTEKDIKITGQKELKLQLTEKNDENSLINDIQVITNKIIKIEGKEKRVVQFSWNLGLESNNYPQKQIELSLEGLELNGNIPEIIHIENLNNMTSYDYKYENNKILFTLKNDKLENGNIMWKKQGNENIILTFIYEKDVNLQELELTINEKVTLYNSKEISSSKTFNINPEEKDGVLQINANNQENSIYKGKLYSNIDKEYTSKTNIQINLAKAVDNISIKEEESKYIINDDLISANVIYNKTIIKKEQFDKIFGQNGVITIYDENSNQIGTITNSSNVDANGNIIVDYAGNEPKNIEIKTTKPISEGKLEIEHIKTIKQNQDIRTLKNVSKISNKIALEYNINDKDLAYTKGALQEAGTILDLQETKTEAKLEINKDTLSTIISNNIEMKITLKSNDEKYDLYTNPQLTITMPEQVQNITINSINLIYEDELKIVDYYIEGRTIKVILEGSQTNYKEKAIEGATIVINAKLQVDKKAISKDETINMTYINEKANLYVDNANEGRIDKKIKIEAPTDVTTINSIKDLSIETIGQEQTKQVMIERGANEKQIEAQIEIINNNEEDLTNVKILGTFPTNSSSNNMGISIIEGITLKGIENAKIYYTENENATDDINNSENLWNENLQEVKNVKKFLILVDKMDKQSSIEGTYKMQIPANLEYNQIAKTVYEVNYSNMGTGIENSEKATQIELQTGAGPIANIKLTQIVGENELRGNVKLGEVIKYKMEISNTGSEDINDLILTAKVPEGTVMVEAEPNYEYTGSSYYKELDNKEYIEKIETLKVGEVITKEYEVRVNKNANIGESIANIATLKYQDVEKESDEVKTVIENGNLRVSVKRVTDRSIDLYESGNVQYFAIIENISNERQDNVKVVTNLQENLKVNRLSLITGLGHEDVSDDDLHRPGEETNESPNKVEITEEELTGNENENIQSEDLEYNKEVEIGSIEPGETKVLSYDITINKQENNIDKIEFSVNLIDSKNNEYRSNKWEDKISKFEISLNMTDNSKGKYLKSGDILEYIITVENKGNSETQGLVIKDNIPTDLTINKITVDEYELQKGEGNNLEIYLTVKPNSTSTIKIETIVNYSEARDEAKPITNVAYAEILGEKVATSPEITHIIEANETSDTGDGDNNNEDNNEDQGDIAEGQRSITGVAWYDENGNGQKDNGETPISNVKVRLLNAATNNLVKDKNGNILETVTNENGIYILDKISSGKYIVIFDYDTSAYNLTKYQAQGVSESVNSDVMKNQLLIENETKEVASTDIIELQDTNISDINIGLIKLQNFDLKLDKYVTKIIIQNNAGTTVKEYDDTTMAKAEIDAKQLNGTNVVVEYKIVVSNVGEVEGYVRKIADYIPEGLEFSSEMNKDWYQSGDTLYNTSIANEKILAGESKILTLTLTKTMTEDNLGRINNRAEIAEAYNELGLADSNSTPGNKVQGENDLGSADIILSIRTGGGIYIAIVIITLIALGAVAFIVIKIRKNKKEKII